MTVTYPSITIDLDNGNFINFNRQQIINASIVEEVNLISAEMAISTLEFTIINTDNSFNMFNGDIYSKLKEKLPISVYQHIDSQEVFIGQYYLDTWKSKNDQKMEFTAIDVVGVLEDIDFDGIFWENPVSLQEAMTQIFTPIGILFEVDASIQNRQIKGWIPPSTYRNALQQICFATRAVAQTARTNKLSLEPIHLPNQIFDYKITKRQSKQNNVEIPPIVSSVELVSHNYSQSGVLETIFDKFLDAGSHKIVFEKPYYGIVVDGAGYIPVVLGTEAGDYIGTEFGDYLEGGGEFTFGSNSVHLDLATAGQVTITGYAWLDSKRSYVFNEPNTESLKNKKKILISDATLVSTDIAETVLGDVRDYYKLKYLQDLTFLPSLIKVADIILTDTINTERIIGTVQRSEIDLTGGFLSKSKVLGILPSYVSNALNPYRVARTGISTTNAELTRNNQWRQYA